MERQEKSLSIMDKSICDVKASFSFTSLVNLRRDEGGEKVFLLFFFLFVHTLLFNFICTYVKSYVENQHQKDTRAQRRTVVN